jgi:hypothetical protein
VPRLSSPATLLKQRLHSTRCHKYVSLFSHCTLSRFMRAVVCLAQVGVVVFDVCFDVLMYCALNNAKGDGRQGCFCHPHTHKVRIHRRPTKQGLDRTLRRGRQNTMADPAEELDAPSASGSESTPLSMPRGPYGPCDEEVDLGAEGYLPCGYGDQQDDEHAPCELGSLRRSAYGYGVLSADDVASLGDYLRESMVGGVITGYVCACFFCLWMDVCVFLYLRVCVFVNFVFVFVCMCTLG